MSIKINNKQALIKCMKSFEQSKGVSIYEHGVSVSSYYKELKSHIITGDELKGNWKLPAWVKNKSLWSLTLPDDMVEQYHIFHDCGKPMCITYDDEGNVHFPEHAATSKIIWNSISNEVEIGELIGMDMDIHQLKAVDLDAFSQRREAATLLLTGLAEIHSNAAMFGGIESVSFKSKYKHILRRGNALVKIMNI
ncbi:hypothetical protein [Psychromonas sp. SP041]|uniref:hypothetical protein n=1 Tax=Psychromonas sp. SP041 TaxID=1365007 RepID=UPI0010C7E186|nr:hypothetical protein [Psychromonas sp. SP041]